MIYYLGDHFCKRTEWSLIYFWIYVYLFKHFSPVANFGDQSLLDFYQFIHASSKLETRGDAS